VRIHDLAKRHGINPSVDISAISLCAPLLGVSQQESAVESA
jgi:hypothetical protein